MTKTRPRTRNTYSLPCSSLILPPFPFGARLGAYTSAERARDRSSFLIFHFEKDERMLVRSSRLALVAILGKISANADHDSARFHDIASLFSRRSFPAEEGGARSGEGEERDWNGDERASVHLDRNVQLLNIRRGAPRFRVEYHPRHYARLV